MEDLAFSAFIAGTAIGYLIWYWARGGGGEQHSTGKSVTFKKRFETMAIFACAFVLVAIFVEREIEAAHPLGPLRLSALNQFVILLAVLAAVCALVMLLRSSARGQGATESNTKVFKSTLVVIFGVVLIMFALVLIWGPHSLYLGSTDRWIASAPLGTLLLGILFGSIGAEWVNYWMSDDGSAR